MKIATIDGAKQKHVIHCDPPALRQEDLEPEVAPAFVGIAYAVLFSLIIFYIGFSIWHIVQ